MGRYKMRLSSGDYRYLMDNGPLTEEEKTILTRVRRGDAIGEIGCDLCLSERTMSRRMAAIRQAIQMELS